MSLGLIGLGHSFSGFLPFLRGPVNDMKGDQIVTGVRRGRNAKRPLLDLACLQLGTFRACKHTEEREAALGP